uniref:ATP synthase complex subunit 8 n=1 Tax=Micropterix calthella TaxID=41027 RepID=A0A076EBB1_9NEOP|nr:ATP synthase F0 subunit 8 [Micropterix calthella]
MPQMMPLNWFFLFIYSIIIYLIFNYLNYFNTLNLKMKNNVNIINKKYLYLW